MTDTQLVDPVTGAPAGQVPVYDTLQLTVRQANDGTYTYIGEALPGAATSAPVWRIQRITNADNTVLWADGDANFDNVWDNHLTLTYL